MSIISHLKGLGYSFFEELERAFHWIQPLGAARDNLANNLGGQYGANGQLTQEEFGEDELRMGYDITKLQAMNIKLMVQRMDRTGNLCREFIYDKHISKYASGENLAINEGADEEKLINLHTDRR